MQASEAIRSLIKDSPRWSQNKVASELGLTSSVFSQRMHGKDLKAGFMADIVNLLGGKLVILPPGTPLPKGSIVIDPIDEPYWERKGADQDVD